MLALLLGSALGLAAPADQAGSPAAAPPPAAAAALAAGDCVRCHAHPALAPVAVDQSCADCHAFVRDTAADPARSAAAREVFPLWDRYVASVQSYLAVPDLQAASRLDAGALAAWLGDPHDLRPGMDEGMPRLALSADQRGAIARWLTDQAPPVAPAPPPSPDRAAAGAAVYGAHCAGCHAFGRLDPVAELPAAPDLIHARDRMDPDTLLAWIQDPQRFSPTARMPRPALAPDAALAVRDHLLLADAAAPPAPALAAALPPPVTRPVAWAEVEARVFGRICVHCHMDPDQNAGRAGPGNAGGFGWAATGIELQTREGVRAAMDRIPAALARRRVEAARDVVAPGQAPAELARPDQPGMPLGLPPLSDADTALVLGWIAQGGPP